MKFRKTFLLFTIFTLLVGSSVVSAKKGVSESEIDQYLIDNGTPVEEVSKIPYSAKLRLYDLGATFVSVKSTKSNIYEPAAEGSMMPLSFAEDFEADLYTYQTPNTVNKQISYELIYTWDWDEDPDFTLEDQFAIAWTDDWNLRGSHWEYRWSGTNNLGAACSGWDSGSNVKQAPPGTGVAWEIDLRSDLQANCGIKRHSGYGHASIYRQHDGSGNPEVTSAVGNYFHKFNAIANGVVTFGGGANNNPELGISWSSFYSSPSAEPHSWTWYHKNYF